MLLQCNASMVRNFNAEAIVALRNTRKNKDTEGGLTDWLNPLGIKNKCTPSLTLKLKSIEFNINDKDKAYLEKQSIKSAISRC